MRKWNKNVYCCIKSTEKCVVIVNQNLETKSTSNNLQILNYSDLLRAKSHFYINLISRISVKDILKKSRLQNSSLFSLACSLLNCKNLHFLMLFLVYISGLSSRGWESVHLVLCAEWYGPYGSYVPVLPRLLHWLVQDVYR